MLKIRRGRIRSITQKGVGVDGAEVELESGEVRPALSYRKLTGRVEEGDEVLVNIEALDLSLGSGGFDLVLANLTRGLEGEGTDGAETMKLNYTPIQHAVTPLEEKTGLDGLEMSLDLKVGVIALHGQLAATACSLKGASGGKRVAYIQTGGGALPGSLSSTAGELLERGFIAEHVTVSPSFGGQHEAITLVGALKACDDALDCEIALIGPGPGIQGSASVLGHGGIEALTSSHAALALGSKPTVVPRASSADSRDRHKNLSHHTATVLKLLLAPVTVSIAAEDLDSDLHREIDDAASDRGHDIVSVGVDEAMSEYAESGLLAQTMGRSLDDDPLFFRQAIAGGLLLAGQGVKVA